MPNLEIRRFPLGLPEIVTACLANETGQAIFSMLVSQPRAGDTSAANIYRLEFSAAGAITGVALAALVSMGRYYEQRRFLRSLDQSAEDIHGTGGD